MSSPRRHTWLISSGLHPIPGQLKTRPYGSKLLFGKRGEVRPPMPRQGKDTEQRLAVPWTQSPGTYPELPGVTSTQHRIHQLPAPDTCYLLHIYPHTQLCLLLGCCYDLRLVCVLNATLGLA